MIDSLTTREVALLFWSALLLVWSLVTPKTRSSLLGVVEALLKPKLLLIFGLTIVFIVCEVTVLKRVGLWTADLLKDTVLWAGVAVFTATNTAVSERDESAFWRGALGDQLKAVVAVEYIISVYTLPLLIEIIAVPVIAILVMADVVVEHDKALASARKFTSGALALIGMFVFGYAAIKMHGDIGTLDFAATLRSMVLVPLLSLLLIPQMYVLRLLSLYEQVFLRIRIGREKSPQLKRYARMRVAAFVGLSSERANMIVTEYAYELMKLASRADVDALLRSLLSKKYESVPAAE